MLDFLVFVLYIQEVKQVTCTEAKIEATQVCENVFWTPYSRDERVVDICESVWRESFPNAYILK